MQSTVWILFLMICNMLIDCKLMFAWLAVHKLLYSLNKSATEKSYSWRKVTEDILGLNLQVEITNLLKPKFLLCVCLSWNNDIFMNDMFGWTATKNLCFPACNGGCFSWWWLHWSKTECLTHLGVKVKGQRLWVLGWFFTSVSFCPSGLEVQDTPSCHECEGFWGVLTFF